MILYSSSGILLLYLEALFIDSYMNLTNDWIVPLYYRSYKNHQEHYLDSSGSVSFEAQFLISCLFLLKEEEEHDFAGSFASSYSLLKTTFKYRGETGQSSLLVSEACTRSSTFNRCGKDSKQTFLLCSHCIFSVSYSRTFPPGGILDKRKFY